jgi:hypothetical protein
MSAITNLRFFLMNDWTKDYFSFENEFRRDSNHITIWNNAFNDETSKCFEPLPEFNLLRYYLHCDLGTSDTHGYVSDMLTNDENHKNRGKSIKLNQWNSVGFSIRVIRWVSILNLQRIEVTIFMFGFGYCYWNTRCYINWFIFGILMAAHF